jgi:hypothetical protein
MAVISMAVLCCLFLQQVISHFGDVSQPSCSPDLAAPDYCCSLNHSYIYRQLMQQNIFYYKERKKTNIILQETNIVAILIFKTSMMVLYGC